MPSNASSQAARDKVELNGQVADIDTVPPQLQCQHPNDGSRDWRGTWVVGFCILIVEDELLLALDLECMLREAGYEVCGVATDADEAVQAVSRHTPDLALMDVRLAHDSSGIDAARRLRDGWNVPSIFVSANLDRDTRADAMAAAPLGFVDKPYRQHDVLAAVASAASRLAH